MRRNSLIVLLGGLGAVSAQCTIPTTPLSNTITTPFRIQVQNASYPNVHNLYMNLLEAGGGDKHLYIGPVGAPTFDLVLTQGYIEKGVVHAVIGGEHSTIDNTDKMFMTERGDPKALFQPTYACNPDTGLLQIELAFVTWANHPPGGWICVRPTYDNAYEFRYYPPGNLQNDPNKFCVKVTLVALLQNPSSSSTMSTSTTSTSSSTSSSAATTSSSSSSTSSTSSSASPTSSSTSSSSSASTTSSSSSTTSSASSTTSSTSSTTSSASSTTTSASSSSTTSSSTTTSASPNSTPLPYTDMTSVGFAFLGCAPEDRTSGDNLNTRTLSGTLYADDALTEEKCMAFCSGKGYKYAGTEYSRECWCGNSYPPTRKPLTTKASLSGCSMKCSGNTAQYCGGPSWLSLYQACVPGSPCVNQQFT